MQEGFEKKVLGKECCQCGNVASSNVANGQWGGHGECFLAAKTQRAQRMGNGEWGMGDSDFLCLDIAEDVVAKHSWPAKELLLRT